MALQSLEQQALDRFGDTLAGTIGIDTEMLDDMWTRAFRAVVNRVNMYNRIKLSSFSAETEVANASGTSIDTLGSEFITAVLRKYNDESLDYPCRRLLPQDFALCTHDDSMYKAFKSDPVYTIRNGTIYAKPDPTVTDVLKIYAVKYPATVDASVETTLSGVADCIYPLDLEHAALIWVHLNLKWRATEYYRKKVADLVAAVTGTFSVTNVVYTSVTTKTVTHNSGFLPVVQVLDSNNKIIIASVIHTDTDEFVVTFPVARTGTIIYGTFDGSGLLTNYLGALPTWTASNVSDATYATTVPAAGNLAALTNAIPTYAAIDLSAITLPDVLADPTGSAPSMSALTASLAGIDRTRIDKLLEWAGDLMYKSQADGTTDAVFPSTSADFSYFFKDDDPEMAQTALGGVSGFNAIAEKEIQAAMAALGSHSSDVQMIVGEYSGAVSAYNAKIQGLINTYNSNLQRYIQGIKTALEEYATEHKLNLEIFLGEFGTVVKQYQAEYEQDMMEWKAGLEKVIALHTASLKEEAARVGSELEIAKSYLQAASVQLQGAYQITNSAQYINYEIQELEKEFDMEVRAFCGVQVSDQSQTINRRDR